MNSRNGNIDYSKKQSMAAETWRRLRKNRMAVVGLWIFTIMLIVILLADVIAPYGINDHNSAQRFVAPSRNHLFGTDNFGRDIFSRVIHGGKITLSTGLFSTLITAVIGISLGAISGYFGRRTDNLIMRFLDILMAMPALLLAITIATTLGSGLINAMIAVGIANSPGLARLTRSQVLSIRTQEYIEAAHSIDASNAKIIVRHVLPNALSPIIVFLTMNVASAILSASTLSFLGLGVRPPSPEWGAMLSHGREYLRHYWWITTFPGVMIMLSVFSLNVLGDGLRDALDPKLKN
jgi:peptide/nickel transport system permease protein